MLFGSKSFKDGQTRRIVVVGGGYAGTTASQKLAEALKKFPVEITMIEMRDTFHHVIGSPRAVVEAGFENQLFVPYDNFAKDLPNLKVKTNTSIQSVEATHLVTATSEIIPFDYLVLATGSNNREIAKFPTKPKAASAKAVYKKIQENVKAAASFVVVGGGAVGVEIAGELLTDFPDKPVTLIHAGKKLLEANNVSDAMRASVKQKLEELGCKVILGEAVELPKEEFTAVEFAFTGRRTLRTSTGREVESDMQFICVGNGRYNGSLITDSFPAGYATETGELRSKKTFQLDVEGLPQVFAFGDVSTTTKHKTYMSIMFGSGVLVDNIVSLVKAELGADIRRDDTAKRTAFLKTASGKLKEFGGVMQMGSVMIGRNGGRVEMPVVGVVGDWMAKSMKSKDAMAPAQWKALSVEIPH